MRGQHSHELLVACAAALFVVAHLLLAQPLLEDIDSINFALGVASYDVAAHQPHPPGYPVFIAAARAVAAVLAALGAAEPIRYALVLLSGLAGGGSVWLLYRLLVSAQWSARAAAWTAIAWSVAPLLWITAARPLSDVPGLAAALAVQGLCVRAWQHPSRLRTGDAAGTGLLAGLAIGVRSQVAWLTVPVALVALIAAMRRGQGRHATAAATGAGAGVGLWLVPLLLDTGGVRGFLGALQAQADEDFAGVPMLATSFGLGRLATVLVDTLLHPWGTVWLAGAVVALVLAGTVRLARRDPRHLGTLAILYLPYAALHVLFQETETTRYALPLVVPTVALAVAALMPTAPGSARLARPGLLAAAALTLLLAVVSVMAHRAYRHEGLRAPEIFATLRAAARERPPDVVLMHRRVWAETRRVRQIEAPLPHVPVDAVPRAGEWRALDDAFEAGGPVHAWWLTDPLRGDRAAMDPRSLQRQASFSWPAPVAWLLGGMRPHAFDWYVIDDPTWVLGDGWALTPELAGQTQLARGGTTTTVAAEALIRRRGVPQTLLVGGRLFTGTSADVPVSLHARVGTWEGERTIDEPGPFTFVWQVPPEATPAAARTATVSVRADGADLADRLVFEQFDLQDMGVPVAALAEGWYEPERDVVTGRTWRWMADAATLQIWGAPCAVRLHLEGTWPRHYASAPVLTLRTDTGAELHRGPLSRPFAIDVTVAAGHARGDAPMRVELVSDQSFVAGERTGTADARRLALEVATLRVEPAGGGRACAPMPAAARLVR